jgi:hypothetical protein
VLDDRLFSRRHAPSRMRRSGGLVRHVQTTV